ncbi:hypothetical protein GCM10010924_02900 [Rhizobium wenxiniae]|nr:hypothetical protein GCM10010924_02900 [Rhizobium wenxiniae]
MRMASLKRGRLKEAPRLTEATKASMDMPTASAAIVNGDIDISHRDWSWTARKRPCPRDAAANGLAWPCMKADSATRTDVRNSVDAVLTGIT